MRGMLKTLGVAFLVLLPSVCAFAESVEGGSSGSGLAALAAGLGLGLAVIGGALAQGKICASAMEGIARNPNAQEKMFVSMIIGLVLIESLVIYMLVVSFKILG